MKKMRIHRLLSSMMATMTLIMGTCFMVNGQNDTAQKKSMSDAAFVAKSIKDNQMEIDMSQMAIDKSDNQKIKALAQQMMKDHTKMLQDLREIEGNVSNGSDMIDAGDSAGMSQAGDTGTASNQLDMAGTKTSNSDTSAPAQSTTDTSTAGQGTSDSSTSGHGISDTSAMGHSMDTSAHGMDANESGSVSHHDAMMNASGTEFNDMWVAHMLDAHTKKLAELRTKSKDVKNPELKQIVQTAIPKVKMHKDRLEAINGKGSSSAKSKQKS